MKRSHVTPFLITLAMITTVSTVQAQAPPTLRLDYYHTGNAREERFSLDRVVIEPLPWPGNPARPIDDTNLGKYLFEVRDAGSGTLLYSRGFASVYGEWETTPEADQLDRTFHESLRFPRPAAPVRVVLKKRDRENHFQEVGSFKVDPADMFVDPAHPAPQELITIANHGPSAQKVDLLFLGDGYTAAERPLFEKQVRKLAETFFATPPFDERRTDFNLWAICPEARESGVARPSTGIYRRSPLGTTYDAFGSERYVLNFENRALRDVAAWAPYEFLVILVNNETYGGGGIFGLYSTLAGGNDWAPYLFIHEFGHHFAGLADEYYTSSVAYEIPEERLEPWEVNVTALQDPKKLKWADLATPGVALPTPWPKEAFEEHSAKIQERRRQIRAERRPESEMSALFREQQAFDTKLLSSTPETRKVGAFEGANYAPKGYFRSQADCIMFTRDEVPFCAACRRGLETVIDLYTRGASP